MMLLVESPLNRFGTVRGWVNTTALAGAAFLSLSGLPEATASTSACTVWKSASSSLLSFRASWADAGVAAITRMATATAPEIVEARGKDIRYLPVNLGIKQNRNQ